MNSLFGKQAETPLRSMVRTGTRNFFLLFLLLSSASAHAAVIDDECSPARMDAFRASAQTQSDDTETLFKEMKDCSQYRSELLLWMGYYYRSRGDYQNTLSQYDTEIKSESSERDRLLGRANRGQSHDLAEAMEAKNSPYPSDAEAVLVLARAMTRDGEYKKSRAYYQQYLKLKPDDAEIEVEYAYTFLWAGDTKQAQSNLEKLRKNAKTTEEARAAREGLKRLKVMAPHSFSEVIDRSDHFTLGLEQANNNFFNFSRSTTYATYTADHYDFTLRSHFLSSSKYPSAFGLEGAASRSFNLSQTVSFYAKLGYFSAGKSGVPLAHLFIQKQTKSGLAPGIGFYNDALARDIPLPKDDVNWFRSAFYFKLLFKQWLEYRLELRTVTSNPSSTSHSVRLNIPLQKNEDGINPFVLYLLGETESFNGGSPYIYSPRSYTALRAGGEYTDKVSDEMDLKLSLDYGPFYESTRGATDLTYGSSANLLGLGGQFSFRLQDDFYANFKVRFDRTSSDAGTTYASTLFGLNVVWLLGETP